MKTQIISLNFILTIIALLIFGVANGQTTCPPIFTPGPCIPPPSTPPPPPTTPNPSTEDHVISEEPDIPTTHIPLCYECPSDPGSPAPGGGYGGGWGTMPLCIFTNIQNTGNDIQKIENSNLVAKAIVWDSDCPAFSLIVSENPNTQVPLSASFVAELDGSIHGTITDPDIIIGQKDVTVNEIAILIVYELTDNGVKKIAYEQWNYNYINKKLYRATVAQANYISGPNSANPNIDGNNENQFAIVFEEDGEINSYVDHINSPTIISSPALNISSCIGSNGMYTPDVSISDDANFHAVISYVFNFGFDLFVVQEDFSALIASSPTCDNVFPLNTDFINPRISSPSKVNISDPWEFAVTAVDIDYRRIAIFYNTNNPNNPGGYSTAFLNYAPGSLDLLLNCNNTMPAITFVGSNSQTDKTVAVSWTYDDCTGLMMNNQEVFAVNYDLKNHIRTPYHPDYYMPVNKDMLGQQYASSIAGKDIDYVPGEVGNVFYALASNNADKIIHKMSNIALQPLIRKKEQDYIKSGNHELKVFPNPAEGQIYIYLSSFEEGDGPITISIFNIEGKVVFENEVSYRTVVEEIDVHNYEAGVYYIAIRSKEFTTQEKIVIK